ncbi:MAG: response regulator [Gammaproteobacteria bacterium]
MRVLIVDDHAIVRASIKSLLQESPEDITVLEAATGEEAVLLAREQSFDIILLDLNMPGIGGMETASRLLRYQPDTKILVISTQSDKILPKRLIALGALGYLHKGSQKLLEAIQTIQSGKTYIDPIIAEQVSATTASSTEQNKFECLSGRELQVLLMVARGINIQEIAEKLFLSNKTVNGYRVAAMKKLGIKTDIQATKLAIEYGLIEYDSQ